MKMIMMTCGLAASLLFLLSGCVSHEVVPNWHGKVESEVRALGYGNWVVIADASYPYKNNNGYRTISIDAEAPEVIDHLINSIEQTQHVRPHFYVSRELRAVNNEQAPGIDLFRQQLRASLHGYAPRELEESMLKSLVKDGAENFTVLVIKTQTTLPYSSIFVDLDSGYWDRDAEQTLRKKIQEQTEAAKDYPTISVSARD